jgi:hypothetical protein
MATQSKTAQWDVTVDDGSSFVVSANGKSKAENMASEHLAEIGKPAAKFQIANVGTGDAPEGIVAPAPHETLADDLLSGIDATAPAAPARQAKPDPKPAGKGKPGRKQNSAAVRARKTAEANKAAKASDEAKATKVVEQAEAQKRDTPAKSKGGKRGPTIAEQLDSLADEAAEVWNTLDVGEMNAREFRSAVKAELERRHPKVKTSQVLSGRIPQLLNRKGIDARQLPGAKATA